MGRMRTSAKYAAAVCAFVGSAEGLRQVAYLDPVGIPTICFGETKNVRMGQTATKAECTAMLKSSLIEHEDGMDRCLRQPLPDHVRLAFLSVTYNIGIAAFCRSSMARRWNAGDHVGACDALLLYNKARVKGVLVVLPGLDRRRKEERAICGDGMPA